MIRGWDGKRNFLQCSKLAPLACPIGEELEPYFRLQPQLARIRPEAACRIVRILRQQAHPPQLAADAGVPLVAVVQRSRVAVEAVVGHGGRQSGNRLDLCERIARAAVEIAQPGRRRDEELVRPAVELVQ